MAVMIALLLCVLLVYTASTYTALKSEMRREAAGFLQVYGGELKGRIARMDTVLSDLLLQNRTNLPLLKSANESKRFYASQDVHNYLVNVLQGEPSVSGLVVADTAYGICVDAAVGWLGYWDREAMRGYTLERAEGGGGGNRWEFVTLGGRTYLCKQSVYQGRAAAAFVATSDFLSTVPVADYADQTFLLTDGQDRLMDFRGAGVEHGQLGLMADALGDPYALRESVEILPGQIGLTSLSSGSLIWSQSRVMMAVVLAVILVTLGFGVAIIRFLRRQLIQPMAGMSRWMQRIQRGEYDAGIRDEYGTREFTQLKDSFNRLMGEIMHMKIESYERRLALHDMELKSIRLQLRPHFFLNAIATISSLGTQGRAGEIRAYADALSKNIRYMFKSGLHTVAVGEEIRHVENYFDMQECRYPGRIFHFIELPRELESWPIPQMLVQSFIENEYKYAVSPDSLLTILVRVSMERFQGEDMLLIRIEDDGKGYPQDVLQYMNGEAPRPHEDGERVGLWGAKRMLTLMYERDDLIRLENIQPHGCVNLLRIPAAPRHQFLENTDGSPLGGETSSCAS